MMKFLYKLEKKFGKFAIPNLIVYLLFGQGIAFILSMWNPYVIYNFMFNWQAILQGEIWRLVTFIFIPQATSPIWFFLVLIIYYSIGTSLERTLGTFHFNFYYFISLFMSMVICAIFNISWPIASYVNQTLCLALATLMPDQTFYLYFFIPIKAKYLIVFYFVLLGMEVLSGGILTLVLILASSTGYIIYFAIPAIKGQRMRIKARPAQKKYNEQQNQPSEKVIKVAFHKCNVCGKTELDDPDMDFRYCSKCGKEFCEEHLKNHEH
ncbi:hypothetical protein AN640_07880 [Candidatus Epulonipiscium fishelsonii]|uniref:Uncharacterized protein n=1 Tax=Candidatus Epulonipiscium fishelsonii TaxID=77094 RepID=A0ACC8XEK1_9FIRM|nr:hypothetical protein AN640_07880 [Epulopiscium sp. SCG-D08WGA-EpuloA1]